MITCDQAWLFGYSLARGGEKTATPERGWPAPVKDRFLDGQATGSREKAFFDREARLSGSRDKLAAAWKETAERYRGQLP